MAAKLVISGYMANPAGADSPYEYLQVIATEAIDFAATPYTVVWANNGTALANGWVSGTALTYGFSINSGTIAKGQVAYIGGSGKLINGAATTDISAANWLKTINTGTTAGDGFGALNTGGVLGNGGGNADGIAIFDVPVASITNTTVPVDAVFFGTAVGTANPAAGGYVLPTNDIYNNAQGTFGDGTNIKLFPDPASGAFTKLTGTYNAVTGTWTTPRTAATVTNPTALTDIAAAVTIASTTPLPDLTISSSAPATATVNTPFNYTLTLANSGTANATGVSAKFTLPAGVTYNSASGTGFTATQAAGVVTFTGGAIALGGNVPLTINVTPTAAGTVSSAIGAAVADPGSAIAESNETNNSSTTAVTTTVTTTANTPPTIAPSAASTFLTVPTLSGVINDPTDPAKNFGVNFTLADAETAVGNLTLTATSSNTAVVPNANLTISGTGASRNLKINPVGVGFADITVTVSDGTSTTSTVLKYAASAASGTPTTSRFLTGTSDASTAIAIDSNYMVVADDEDQTIRLYDRANSGLPVKSFNFTNSLGLTDLSGGVPREIDIEASTRVGNKIYWLASHSNASGGNLRPNRYRLFATDISGSGATTNLTFAGKYDNLRNDLIAWGNTNGFNFTASAAAGKIPEATTLDGFNIEGLTLAPNGTTAYVAFRAPQVPTSDRTKALIAPITNFTELVTATATSAMIGAPIQLDLGGRGIRSIDRNANNEYLIVAGPADSATGTAPKDFRLYTWTGNAADAPQVRSTNLTALNAGGSFESIVEVPSNLTDSSQIQLLVDNGDNLWYGNNVISKDLPQDNFQKFRSDIVTLGSSPVRIRNIQGASHTSPLATQTVSNVPGVVTAVIAAGGGRGFYIQDPTPDTGANPNSTSEAIFVFLGSSTIANPTVGQSVQVTGRVDEFRPANNATNLTTTQINATVAGSAVSAIASLGTITPTAIGTGGRIQPTTSIQNDFTTTSGNVETGGDFDPTTEGIDFYESLEGMLVQVNNPVVVGPTNNFGEFYVLPDNGTNTTSRTSRGGIAISATDFNPERIQIDDTLLNPPSNTSLSPAVNVGDKLNTVTGVISYSFSNYELLNTAPIPQASVTSGGLTKEVTNLTGSASQLTVATFNVENLDPSDTAKFPAIASRIVTNLKSPDIINVEEIQDNNGATNDGVVAADTTYNTLITAIKTAGGPTYEFRQINPVNNQDGGEPGGNIRVGFLFNPSRVTFVDRPGGTSTTATTVNNVSGSPVLSASPGRIDPTNAAFNTSRKPLVGEFKFNGQSVFIIANHFNSKGGDQPLFGPNQPPTLTSETQRLQQAQIVNNFVDSILAVDANANVIVAGDLNDFQFSEPLNVVRGIPKGTGTAVLQNLIETLPENERYTYNFQGNAQVLDHILASNNLAKNLAGFDVVHINSEFAEQDSDHDPSVARFNIALSKPTVTITATDAAAAELDTNPGTFRITRSGSTALPLTVNYTTASGTGFASTNDFTPNLTGSIIIPAGQSFADVTITPIDDKIVEGSEALKLTLVGTAAYNLGAAGTQTATVAIADNDTVIPTAGIFNFSNATYSVNENGTTQTITVNRTGATNVSASVSYATANGSATAGSDYTATSGTLNFLSGETSKTFSIPIANDTLVEGNETVNLSLTNATNNASLGDRKTAILTIVDTTPTPTPTPAPTPIPTPTPTPAPDLTCIGDRIERPNLDRPNPVDNIINGNSRIIIGTPRNDGYVGTNNPNIFDGKAGNDNLIGGKSADLFNGNEGNDFIDGKGGNDILLGGKGNDIIIGGFGKDVIFGNQGNDSLNGKEDDDLISGNEGNDFIDGGKGNDTLFGSNGQDLMLGSEGNDTLFGELGDDTLSGDAGNDLVYGGQGNDLIDGGKGNDSIYGDKGNDTLLGCEGSDILFGGLGNDSLIGGLGNDTFVVGNNLGLDIISGFVKGEDVLGLSGGLSFNQLKISQSNSNTLIEVNGIAIASLIGINASLIGVNDFRTV